jgi:hypothetical protein
MTIFSRPGNCFHRHKSDHETIALMVVPVGSNLTGSLFRGHQLLNLIGFARHVPGQDLRPVLSN